MLLEIFDTIDSFINQQKLRKVLVSNFVRTVLVGIRMAKVTRGLNISAYSLANHANPKRLWF